MKTYSDIHESGGAQVLEQVISVRKKIKERLSSVKNLVLIGSGKGGVGKSSMSAALGLALRDQGFSVCLLDADLNGPSLGRIFGMMEKFPVPGPDGLLVPKTEDGVGLVSMGSFLPESESLEFASVAHGDSFTWRATKEFTTLAQLLVGTDWGELDFLLVDLPPGPERTFYFAEFFGEQAKLILVSIPADLSRGVVLRSTAALQKLGGSVLGFVENMRGYYCSECNQVRPLFSESRSVSLPLFCLGGVPFDPRFAALCDQGMNLQSFKRLPTFEAMKNVSQQLSIQLSAQLSEEIVCQVQESQKEVRV